MQQKGIEMRKGYGLLFLTLLVVGCSVKNSTDTPKKEFRELGITYKSDLVVRPLDRLELLKLWKKAAHSDLNDPQIQRIIAALKSKKMAPVVLKEVQFKIGSQLGVFAAAEIKKGTVVGQYSGKLQHCSDINYRSNYVFGFKEKAYLMWGIDALDTGNYTRFINHSYNGNLSVINLYYGKLPRIVFIANRDINEGEELRYDYGKGYWSSRGIEPE